MLETLGIISGAMLIVLGFAGSILPVLPGPPLSYLGLLLLALIRDFAAPLTPGRMIVLALITAAVAIGDQALPFLSAKRYGTSRWGIWGSLAGMAVGMFFSPLGMIAGAMAGVLAVELVVQRKKGAALRASRGVLVGTLLGLGLKLGWSGVLAYYFIRGL